jgi:PAS domain S-box-containing protein
MATTPTDERPAVPTTGAAPSALEATVFDRMTDSVAVYDCEGRFLYLNPVTERLFGVRREAVLGRSLWEIAPEAVGNPFHVAFQRVVAGGGPETFEHYYEPWGQWFENQMVPLAEGVCVFGRDVTARKRLEGELQASDARLRLALESARMAAWDWDPAADRVTAVGDIEGIYGVRDVDSGARGFALVHADDRERHRRVVAEALERGGSYRSEFRVVRPDTGEVVWMEERARATAGPDGARLTGVVIDVSARRAVERALGRREEELQVIADAVPVLIAYVDASERYRLCNRAYLEWFAPATGGPLAGRRLRDVLGEAAYEAVRPHVSAALAGRPAAFEFEATRRDGGPRWVEATYTPHAGPGGEVIGFVSMLRDVSERRRAEREREAMLARVAASEARFRRLYEAGFIGVVFWTRAGALVEANDTFLQMVGYSRDDLRAGRVAWRDMTPPEFAAADERAFAEMERRGVCTPYEKEYLHKDGRRVPILLGVAFWEGSTDEGVAWILDIRDRKRDEQRRDLLVDAGRILSSSADFRDTLAEVTRLLARRFATAAVIDLLDDGGRPGAHVAVACHDPALEAATRDQWRRATADPDHLASRAAREGGVWHTGALTPGDRGERDDRGDRGETGHAGPVRKSDGATGAVSPDPSGVLQNVPSDVAAEGTSESDGASVASGADDLTGARAAGGANVRTRAHGPGDEGPIVPDGSGLRSGGSPFAPDGAGTEARTLLGSSGLIVPLVSRARTLGSLWVSSSERPYDHDDVATLEELGRRAGGAIDAARLFEVARAESARAEEANRAKDEFLAVVSHELRTPLNAMLGWAKMLQTGALPPERQRQAYASIERNARAQAQLVDDLLDVSRIITGKLRLNVGRVDLPRAVAAAVETVRPTAEAKGVALHVALDPGAGPVSGDADRLQQVVWNLLSNALRHTPRGGRVDVRLAARSGEAEVRVEDTGEGIAPAFLPHLFERFRQADASTTRPHGGLGLGLSIVKHLVELHGGSVAAESAGAGRGATFLVRLPLAPSAAVPGPRPAVDAPVAPVADGLAPPPELAGLRVLVVDDEADARELLGALLAHAGVEVEAVASAEAALERLRAARYDVIVSDVGMPGVDGYAFLRRVRALPDGQGGRTPAVALTAFARLEDRTRALLAGFQIHVPKPVEPAELLAVVASVVARRR